MTEATRAKIPAHLNKYIVEQNYSRYTPEDQAVWRYIMRQLKSYLSIHAHEIYLEGLKKSGIEVESIPHIDDIDAKLNEFGWGAVPVSGFIPPAAFMEFQAIGVLPIASDMRTIDHLLYTPAPDIVHEAAGHAPILADPEYAAYLRQYGEVARHSILSKEDLAQYEAIRVLSDLKEDPSSTPEQIARAEKHLQTVNANMTSVSEAALLSRMNWWTAEYGLIGDLQQPKIFGAGLLSSVGEASACLDPKVKKIPLSVSCVDFSYDITEPQPQLFVTEDFTQLGDVLEHLASRLAYRRGGVFGLQRAIEAGSVNTVQLNSGIQISGVVKKWVESEDTAGVPAYLQFSGPCQLSCIYQELPGQGTGHHPAGFSTPLGLLKNHQRCLSTYSDSDLANMAIRKGSRSRLIFESGVHVEGIPVDWIHHQGQLILISWKDARVTLGDQILFDPAWGDFDMAVGSNVTSVFGGPADRLHFGQTEDFTASRVAPKIITPEVRSRHAYFRKLRDLREKPAADSAAQFAALAQEFFNSAGEGDWLQAVELLELTYKIAGHEAIRARLLQFLDPANFSSENVRQTVKDGVALAAVSL
jgi:phenylalanine-4-hydroxylase